MFFVYGKYNSKACDKAEFLLYTLGYEYRFYALGVDFTLDQFQRFMPGVNTVPQIFHNTDYVGGVKDLYEYLHKNKSFAEGSRSGFPLFEKSSDVRLEDE